MNARRKPLQKADLGTLAVRREGRTTEPRKRSGDVAGIHVVPARADQLYLLHRFLCYIFRTSQDFLGAAACHVVGLMAI